MSPDIIKTNRNADSQTTIECECHGRTVHVNEAASDAWERQVGHYPLRAERDALVAEVATLRGLLGRALCTLQVHYATGSSEGMTVRDLGLADEIAAALKEPT